MSETMKPYSPLSVLAKTSRLKGKVTITDAKGSTREFASEDEAMAEWKDKIGNLEHRRGAFFEKAAEPKSEKIAEKAVEVAEPKSNKAKK